MPPTLLCRLFLTVCYISSLNGGESKEAMFLILRNLLKSSVVEKKKAETRSELRTLHFQNYFSQLQEEWPICLWTIPKQAWRHVNCVKRMKFAERHKQCSTCEVELDARWNYSWYKQQLQTGVWFANCVKVFCLPILKGDMIILRQW
jgi:hypothetical protein